jgi:hypothetical protein
MMLIRLLRENPIFLKPFEINCINLEGDLEFVGSIGSKKNANQITEIADNTISQHLVV